MEATFLLSREGHLSPDTYIDIVHESLIRQWKILRDQWLPEERKATSTFLGLVARARNWKSQRGELLTGLDLTDAAEWDHRRNPTAAWARHYADESALGDVLEFIKASELEERKRERRRKRKLRMGFAGSVLFALLVCVVAYRWYRARTAELGIAAEKATAAEAQVVAPYKLTAELNERFEAAGLAGAVTTIASPNVVTVRFNNSVCTRDECQGHRRLVAAGLAEVIARKSRPTEISHRKRHAESARSAHICKLPGGTP